MKDDDIVIKPVTINDALLLSTVALQAYRAHYLHLWYDGGEWYTHKNFSVKQLCAEINDDNARFFIVYVNNLPAGFIKVNIDAPLHNDVNALELERIYFIKEVNNKGVGTKTMKYVFALAESLGKQIIWLKVMDSSAAAIAFYKKLGFEICDTFRLDFKQMRNELTGMYMMKKSLK